MNEIQLNLARKWRASQFGQVIGQDLVIRMLKNSLYLDQFFPVYLLSGNRGCGKTSTARVFAAALNCEKLAEFQRNPKQVTVPCLACASCVAMREGKHPDFFEIDAASHTGVDTIRAIIDSSSFMPLLGRKKIYLVDEAHMLSKAAFNALLKILEEPPQSVLFMLATTDPHKIIDTVKSRCFQLLFKPVEQDTLVNHLQSICEREHIACDTAGLALICKETDGCVRDAINVLEQVRFAHDSVTKDAVLSVLGYLDDERLMLMFEKMLYQSPQELMQFLQEIQFSLLSADRVFEQVLSLIRDAMWVKHGVMPPYGVDRAASLKKMFAKCSWQRLHDIGSYFYDHEQHLMRTTQKHALLEVMLLQIAKKNDPNIMSGSSSAAALAEPASGTEDVDDDGEEDQVPIGDSIPDDEAAASGDAWTSFLARIAALNDPLVLSIFKQGKFAGYVEDKKQVMLVFSKDFLFFNDWLNDTKAVWLPIMQEIYGQTVTCAPQFIEGEKTPEIPVHAVTEKPKMVNPPVRTAPPAGHPVRSTSYPAGRGQNTGFTRTKSFQPRVSQGPLEERIDVSDSQRFFIANSLLQYFPGTITKVQEKNV